MPMQVILAQLSQGILRESYWWGSDDGAR